MTTEMTMRTQTEPTKANYDATVGLAIGDALGGTWVRCFEETPATYERKDGFVVTAVICKFALRGGLGLAPVTDPDNALKITVCGMDMYKETSINEYYLYDLKANCVINKAAAAAK